MPNFDKFKKDMELIKSVYDFTYHPIVNDMFFPESTIIVKYDALISALIEHYDDEYDWIYWYIFETEWGTKNTEVKINDTTIIVDSLDALWFSVLNRDKQGCPCDE